MKAWIAIFAFAVTAQGSVAPSPATVCDGQPTKIHKKGGGRVALTAYASSLAFISGDSAICGNAQVRGAARILGGSIIRDSAVVSNSILYTVIISDFGQIWDSEARFSTIRDEAAVTGNSDVMKSTIGGRMRLHDCIVDQSTFAIGVGLTGQTLSGINL